MSIGKYNKYQKYQLLDSNGIIVDKFYHENTARQFRNTYKNNFKERLRLVLVNEEGKIIKELKSGDKKNVVTEKFSKDL